LLLDEGDSENTDTDSAVEWAEVVAEVVVNEEENKEYSTTAVLAEVVAEVVAEIGGCFTSSSIWTLCPDPDDPSPSAVAVAVAVAVALTVGSALPVVSEIDRGVDAPLLRVVVVAVVEAAAEAVALAGRGI
jgi:hypothetical protein